MLNLIDQGLAMQRLQLDAYYSRPVGKDELLFDVQQEAIKHHCYVWVNPAKRMTVIQRDMPRFGHWVKLNPGDRHVRLWDE